MSNSSRPMPVPSAVISVPISGTRQHLVEARAFHVQDLAAQRQDGLGSPIAPGLAEPPALSPSTMNSFGLWPGRVPDNPRACPAARRHPSPSCGGSVRAPCGRLRGPAAASTILPMIFLGLSRVFLEPAFSFSRPGPRPPGAPRTTPACPWSGWRTSGPAPSRTARRSGLRGRRRR